MAKLTLVIRYTPNANNPEALPYHGEVWYERRLDDIAYSVIYGDGIPYRYDFEATTPGEVAADFMNRIGYEALNNGNVIDIDLIGRDLPFA